MGKKITNLIREGLPSKIYLAAYGGPMSGYRIGQLVYDTKNPHLSKIYSNLDLLIEKKAINRVGPENVLSNSRPFLSEIKKTLNEEAETDLSEFEVYMLSRVLDSKEFRDFISSAYGSRTLIGKDMDSFQTLSYFLVTLALGVYFPKCTEEYKGKLEPTTRKEFDALFDTLSNLEEESGEASFEGEKKEISREFIGLTRNILPSPMPSYVGDMLGIMNSTETIKAVAVMYALPKFLLEKLIRLQPEIYALMLGMVLRLKGLGSRDTRKPIRSKRRGK